MNLLKSSFEFLLVHNKSSNKIWKHVFIFEIVNFKNLIGPCPKKNSQKMKKKMHIVDSPEKVLEQFWEPSSQMILLKLMVTISSPASKNFSGPVVSPCPHVGPKEATSIIARAMMILTGVFQSWYLLGSAGLFFLESCHKILNHKIPQDL